MTELTHTTIESRSEFARRLGVHRSQVTRWAQKGRLVETATGRVLVKESLARLEATEGGRPDATACSLIARRAMSDSACVSAAEPERQQ
jgi:hypothetical protein